MSSSPTARGTDARDMIAVSTDPIIQHGVRHFAELDKLLGKSGEAR